MSSPAGVVTLLFTDIEGSTRLWEDRPDAMELAMVRHDTLVREAIEREGGRVFKTVGDAFCAAFEVATDAVRAALAVQRALAVEQWAQEISIRVRIALHSGACIERGGDYFGRPVNRVARLVAIGHGGQVLMSVATRDLVADRLGEGVTLLDLGDHRLKDLSQPERVFQVCAPGLADAFGPLVSLDNPRLQHNLPIQATSFIGRATELAELSELLLRDDVRLVTLTGAGGVGKTRLGLQVAAQLVDGTGGGVWLVELAALTDPHLVEHEVAAALGVREQAGQELLDTMAEVLADREVLIMLDNCEHLLDAVARLVDAMLKACPGVHLLATSREPLRVNGECVYRVPSLSVPDADDVEPSEVAASEAVQLFIERAAAQRYGFALDATNAGAIAELCVRLDGIPLATELAAARVGSMSAAEINKRLDRRFQLLTSGSRNALPRQQTLRALIDWSYDLLDVGEKLLLARLSVFAGGWAFEAAEAVCGRVGLEERQVVDHLASLVDKSIVQADQRDGATRYRLLETVRQYAAERLAKEGEIAVRAVGAAHRDYYLFWAETAAAELRGPEQRAWLDRLETEHDNVAAALAFCIADHGDTQLGLRLAGRLRWFWEAGSRCMEGADALEALLAQSESSSPDPVRAHALNTLSALFVRLGRVDASASRALQALALAKQLAHDGEAADALSNLSWVSFRQGALPAALREADDSVHLARRAAADDLVARCLIRRADALSELGEHASARRDYQEALTIFRASGNHRGVAGILNNLGVGELSAGVLHDARTHLEDALALARRIDVHSLYPYVVDSLGWLEVAEGNYQRARELFVDSLSKAGRAGFRGLVDTSLIGLAVCAADAGDERLACTLLSAVDEFSRQAQWTFESFLASWRDRNVAHLRETMGDAAFETADQQGRGLSRADAIALALSKFAGDVA